MAFELGMGGFIKYERYKLSKNFYTEGKRAACSEHKEITVEHKVFINHMRAKVIHERSELGPV